MKPRPQLHWASVSEYCGDYVVRIRRFGCDSNDCNSRLGQIDVGCDEGARTAEFDTYPPVLRRCHRTTVVPRASTMPADRTRATICRIAKPFSLTVRRHARVASISPEADNARTARSQSVCTRVASRRIARRRAMSVVTSACSARILSEADSSSNLARRAAVTWTPCVSR